MEQAGSGELDTQPSGDQAPHGGWRPSAFVIAAYLLIGAVEFWPLYGGISTHPFVVGSDFSQSVWFLNWGGDRAAQQEPVGTSAYHS
jgi:hypothetical protein